MAWSLLAHHLDSGTNAVTTTAVDTTGADQILVFVSSYDGAPKPTIGDSAGNTWLQIEQFDYPAAFAYLTIWRAQGPVITSPTHTATVTTTGGVPTAIIAAFSGSDAGTYEVIATNTSSTNNFTTGSVTPGENNALVLSMVILLGATGEAPAATSPQTLIDHFPYAAGVTFGTAASYYAQPTAGAINPAFTWTTSATAMGATVVFKPATGSTINLVGIGATSAIGSITATTAETKAVAGVGISTSSGAIVAAAGGSVSLSGASVSGTPGIIGVSFSARTVSLAGAPAGVTAGTITTNGAASAAAVGRNSLLTRRDWTQEPGVTFSGGSWWTGFDPFSTIDPDFPICAASRLPADTTFDCDLGTPHSVSVIHLQRFRVSWASRVRVRVGTDPTFAATNYDSGIVSGWPAVQDQFATHPFGDWSFAGLADPEEATALGFPRWFIPPAAISVRYARVEIWDRVAAFPPQIGCFGLCEAWELPIDANVWSVESLGAANMQTAEYGSRFASAYSNKRRVNLGLDMLTHNDFVERVMSILPRAGVSVPAAVIVSPDSSEYAFQERIGIYGLLARADITASHYSMYSFPLTLDQL